MSVLSKHFRSAFRPVRGYKFIDIDIKRAHLGILAAYAKDEKLVAWFQEDPHSSTGDLLFPHIKSASQRRSLGKSTNSALVSGAGAGWLLGEYEEMGKIITLEKAQSLIDAWWSRFLKSLAFRENHKRAVKVAVKQGKKWVVQTLGRTVAYFGRKILAGKHRPNKKWPKSEKACEKKAEMSAFTALLRAKEAEVMDELFIKADKLGLSLVVPMYDGALWAAPEEEAEYLTEKLKEVALEILAAHGIETGVEASCQDTWGG